MLLEYRIESLKYETLSKDKYFGYWKSFMWQIAMS